MLDVSVVVPVRNAEAIVDGCLDSLVAAEPREIIVVDGLSTDATLELVHRYPVKLLSDEGRGLPAARILGVREAVSKRVALVDADVVFPDGALAALLDEFQDGGYSALQAGLRSVSVGPGYWGDALAHHHRTGRSKDWFGLVATIFDREVLLRHGFDDRFLSGEDMELRWRLTDAGEKIGVSMRTIVTHRFGDTFSFARGQWLADGHGLARLVRKRGWRAAFLVGLPIAAGIRGVALSLAHRQPRWIPYYGCYVAFNYAGIAGEFVGAARAVRRQRREAAEP
jgi:glycosyltransferase involved in cell wall biosynthesis